MKQMKRGLAVLLAAAMMVTSLPQGAFARERTDLTEPGAEGGISVLEAGQTLGEEPASEENGKTEDGENHRGNVPVEETSEGKQPEEESAKTGEQQSEEEIGVGKEQPGEGIGAKRPQSGEETGTEEKQPEKDTEVEQPQPGEKIGAEEMRPEEDPRGEQAQPGETAGAAEPQPEENLGEGNPTAVRDASSAMSQPQAEPDGGNILMQADDKANARSVVEEYTFLTAGQSLHHTEENGRQYVFAPEESGWYILSGESKGGHSFGLQVDQTRYREGEEEKIYHPSGVYATGTKTDRLLWLNGAEKYIFGCHPQIDGESEAVDIVLQVRKADITAIEAVGSPSRTSFDCLNLEGTQVKVHFADGSSVVEEIHCNYNGYENTAENYLDLFRWGSMQVAYEPGESLAGCLAVQKIDGNTEYTFGELSDGSHTAEVYFAKETGGTSEIVGNVFTVDFEIQGASIQSIEVVDPRTAYTAGFGEVLDTLRIRVFYSDGRKPEVLDTASGVGVRQYLEYRDENGNSCKTDAIDTWLANGNQPGRADVRVQYREQAASYAIQIQAFPYDSLTIQPAKTCYYADCSCDRPSVNGDAVWPGDFSAVLAAKDGAEEVYASLYELSEGNVQCGLVSPDGGLYVYVDDYLAAGGTVGNARVRVSYLGLEAECEVEIRANPYDHIEVAAEPKKTYLCGADGGLDFQGLVIRAYKDQAGSAYDEYSYGEGSGVGEMEHWTDYFSASLGGHESPAYLEIGTHTVALQFMGRTASYDIEVVDKLAGSLSIVTAPQKREYFVGETTECDFQGMVVAVTGLDGTVRQYRYGDYGGEEGDGGEYGSWDELAASFDVEAVNWYKAGAYPVTLSCLGLSGTFNVTIKPSPVVSLEVLQNPDKKEYFQYRGRDVDLGGLKCRVTFSDGTVAEATAEQYASVLRIPYQGTLYDLRASWMRQNIDGLPVLGQNALKLEYLGKEGQTGGIQISQDPIKSIELIKNPERAELCWFGIMDLYGAEVRLTYGDGRTRDVTVTEHGNQVKVEDDYGEMLYAYSNRYGNQWSVGLQYMNRVSEVEMVPPGLASLEGESAPMEEESMREASLNREKPYRIYCFTPSETGTHYFYKNGDDVQLFLYDRNRLLGKIEAYTDSKVEAALTAGRTYYCALSMAEYTYLSGDKEAVDGRAYCSALIRDWSELGIRDFEITEVPKDTWYDFESQGIYLEDGWSLKGTAVRLIYDNGWTEKIHIDDEESKLDLHGETLWAEWKYTVHDDGGLYAAVRDDNALVYWLGASAKDWPVRMNVESPVASMEIKSHPFMNSPLYLYQVTEWQYSLEGLTVVVRYKDGRADDLMRWEINKEEDCEEPVLNGYRASASLQEIEDKDGNPTGKCALSVKYMGLSVETEIDVLPNPIKDIQILQAPEKMSGYPYENQEVDLYGLKLLLTYQDGAATNVQVKEHGSKMQAEDKYKAGLEGKFRYIYDENDNVDHTWLWISYMGVEKEVGEYVQKPIGESPNLTALQLDDSREVTLGAARRYQVYRFTPETGGTYVLTSSGGSSCDTMAEIYNASGRLLSQDDDGGENTHFKLAYTMIAGKTYYLVVRMRNVGEKGSFICTFRKGEASEIPTQNIAVAELSLEEPVAGKRLPGYEENDGESFSLSSASWPGAEAEVADYGTAYRVKLTLLPKFGCRFTPETRVTVNGKRANEKSVSADGRMTVYYTFPLTDCRITIPEQEGYELDQMGNEMQGSAPYGGIYRFRYIKKNSAQERLIVKGNDEVLTADEEGYYVLQPVKENITVYVKTEQVEVKEGEAKLVLHNRAHGVFDVLTGKKNSSLAANETGENTFPTLRSYVEGSDEFFYGWYQDHDGDPEKPNGKGARFTSKDILEKSAYDLYARWASGIFTKLLNNKTVTCKVLSIDEDNRLKVQIGDGGNGSARKTLRGRVQTFAADTTTVLEIPDTFKADETDLKDLGMALGECEVVAIAENAFANETGLSSVVIPETVERIGAGAFSGCSGLREVKIPGSVTEIAENTFNGCVSLTDVVIPEGVSEIRAGAFGGCGSLATVVLPDTIETIDSGAFDAMERKPTLLCSSAVAASGAVDSIKDMVHVQTVDLVVDYEADEVEFVYGESGKTFAAGVSVDGREESGRDPIWTHTDTDAYTFKTDGNKLTVVPRRITREDETVVITAADPVSRKARNILLRTRTIDLAGTDTDGDPLYRLEIADVGGYVYTGKEICPEVTIMRMAGNGPAGIGSENYDLVYENNISAGSARVTVTGKGNYSGSLTARFVIQKKAQTITASDVKKKVGDQPFPLGASVDGDGKLSYSSSNPAVVQVSDTGLVTIFGAGSAGITIHAEETDNYREAQRTVTVTVEKPSDSTGDNTGQKPPTGDNSGQKPPAGNTDQKPPFDNNENQTTKPSENTGTKDMDARLRVPKTSYSKAYGSKAFSLGATARTRIAYKSSNTKVAQVNAKGKVTVKKCGKAVITVMAKDSGYKTATKKVTVRVVPKKAKLQSVKSKKAGQLSVSWKRQKEADGYLVEYSADKKFRKNVKKATLKKNKTTSVTLKKLKKGKKYYVRVKAYKIIDKKKACGSASKSIAKGIKKK